MNNRELLREWREGAELTVTAAADLIGATHPAWLSWESGQKRPSYPLALALEKLTKGKVPATGWLSEEEIAALGKVEPFTRNEAAA